MSNSLIENFILEHVPTFIREDVFNLAPSEQCENAARFTATAEFFGLSVDDLKEACGGDICTFLMDRQNSYFSRCEAVSTVRFRG
ncbi:hypothetical protein [Rhizobium sp. BE258]|uniref:hypothetical protein n=1 Tax=Rhizobium sp. BE258 TaxID=2817722 RepID=UPI00285F5BBB|nr:hypothetical protein [Rhizobium sp. BE258]MDR7145317.1 hypothetical protein [Rhizobium sp. BE258]